MLSLLSPLLVYWIFVITRKSCKLKCLILILSENLERKERCPSTIYQHYSPIIQRASSWYVTIVCKYGFKFSTNFIFNIRQSLLMGGLIGRLIFFLSKTILQCTCKRIFITFLSDVSFERNKKTKLSQYNNKLLHHSLSLRFNESMMFSIIGKL